MNALAATWRRRPLSLSWARGHGAPAMAAGAALVIYLLTLAPDLTSAHHGSDGGELITAAVTLGVPHPPGYPTYVLLGRLVSALPLGTVAFRFNLLSAISVAIAVGFAAAAGRTLLPAGVSRERATTATLAGGLTFAVLPLVWGQALIAEVYALNLALLAALLWALFSRRSPWLAGLLLGLATTTHLTSLAMLPLSAATTPRDRWPALLGGLLLGLAPFLALPLLAAGNSPIVWGNPTTLDGWWWLVSGRLYHPNLFALSPAGWGRKALAWGGVWVFSIIPLLVALAPGRFWQRATGPRPLYLFGTAVVFILYSLAYDAQDAVIFALPALLLLAVAGINGLIRIGRSAYLLPLAILLLNFGAVDLSGRRELRSSADTVWRSAPEDAIVLATGDEVTFTLWYYHYVEKKRPDVVVVDTNLFAFDWYRQRLNERYPELRHLDVDDVEGFGRLNGRFRPICRLRPSSPEEQAQAGFPPLRCQ